MPHPLEKLSWLFAKPKKTKNAGISSAASFNPAKGEWSETTTPSMRSVKKSILLSKNISFEHPYDIIAQLEWLHRDGFTIYFCCDDDGIKKFHPYQGPKDLSKLPYLSYFDNERDYEALGKYVAQDNVVVLNSAQASAINECLQKVTKPEISSNALSTLTTLRFHDYSEEPSTPSELFAHLNAAQNEEKKKAIFEKYKNAIYSHQAMIRCIEIWPAGRNLIWENYKNIFNDIHAHIKEEDCANLLKLWPKEEFDELYAFFNSKSNNTALCFLKKKYIEFYPADTDMIFDKYGISVQSEEELNVYADILPHIGDRLIQKWKITGKPIHIDIPKMLNAWPSGASVLFEICKEREIFYPDTLPLFLQNLPDKAHEI